MCPHYGWFPVFYITMLYFICNLLFALIISYLKSRFEKENERDRKSIIGITTQPRAGKKNAYLFDSVQKLLLVSKASWPVLRPFQHPAKYAPGGERRPGEDGQSTAFNAEVQNEGTCTPTLHSHLWCAQEIYILKKTLKLQTANWAAIYHECWEVQLCDCSISRFKLRS